MKKKLLTILITSIIMIGLLGGFVWKMRDLSGKIAKDNKEKLLEEKDTDREHKMVDDVDPTYVKHLYLSGENKNVLTMQYKNLSAVYNSDSSKKTRKMIQNIKKQGKYNTSDMLWAYNLYGTNKNGLYVYFKSNGSCYVRYTISVADKSVPDFTRTLRNGKTNNVTSTHEYQIIGLVPGKKNYIIMKLYNAQNQLSETVTYDITMPSIGGGVPLKLTTKTGYSGQTVSNGLFAVFHKEKVYKKKEQKIVKKKLKKKGKTLTKRVKKTVTVKKKNNSILLYDNSGILRACVPLLSDNGRGIKKVYDNLVFVCGKNRMVSVDKLGMVAKTYITYGYTDLGEFDYDGAGNVYAIASSVRQKSMKQAAVLKINVENGSTQEILDMKKVLPSVYADAARKSNKKNLDWIRLNSIQVTGVNQVLLSSGKQSMIFKVSNAGSLLPKVDYLIADKKIYKKYTGLKKKVLEKKYGGVATKSKAKPAPTIKTIFNQKKAEKPDPFVSQYGQNAIVRESAGKGKYYLSMINNNVGKGSSGKKVSYFYKYYVNENAKNYILQERVKCGYMPSDGNVQEYDGHLICATGRGKYMMELDQKGTAIRKMKFPGSIYRVYKNEGKEIWFY